MGRFTLIIVAFTTLSFLQVQTAHTEEEQKIKLLGLMYEMGPTYESISDNKDDLLFWRGLNTHHGNDNLLFTIWASDSEKKKNGKLETQIFGLGTDISVVVFHHKPKKKHAFVPTIKILPGVGGYLRIKHTAASEKIPGTLEAGPMEVEVTHDGEDEEVQIPRFEFDVAPYFQFLTVFSFRNFSYNQVAPRVHFKTKVFPERWKQTLFTLGVGVSIK